MISVIIPTYSRAQMLLRVLPSYLQFSSVAEVVVIDDGSPDATSEMVEELQNTDERIRLVRHSQNRGMTFARNTGIANSTGDLVLFSEDDLALTEGSLDILVAHMGDSGADIIAGRRIWMRLGESEAEALNRANRRRWPVVNTRLMEHYSHSVAPVDVESPLVNATMLVRRTVLEKVRFADCYQGNAWREESDFQLTALELGFRVVFCPHAVCYHHDRRRAGIGRNRLKGDVVYLYWVFRNNVTFLRRHRAYLQREYPESLILGSPVLASSLYLIYRTAWLAQVEIRRAWRGRRLGDTEIAGR